MHDARYRQLPLVCVALLWSVAAAKDSPSPKPAREPGGTAAQDLQAARLVAATLRSRNAGVEEWKKLGNIYAGLARKHPRDVAIRDAYGDHLWGMEERHAAIREWQAAERIDPKNFAILNHLGGAFVGLGEPRAAVDYYRRASEAAPDNAAAHFAVANVTFLFRHELNQAEADAVAQALEHFAAAHRLEPKNTEYTRSYAETFHLVPDPDWATALKVWKEYVEIAPDKNFALLNLARVHMKLRQADEARACLSRVQGAGYERQKARLGERIEAELSPPGGVKNGPSNSPKPVIDAPPQVP